METTQEFGTESEALAAMRKLREMEPQWFCPMIAAQCRKDCLCFREARIRSQYLGGGPFTLENAYCNNPTVAGC